MCMYVHMTYTCILYNMSPAAPTKSGWSRKIWSHCHLTRNRIRPKPHAHSCNNHPFYCWISCNDGLFKPPFWRKTSGHLQSVFLAIFMLLTLWWMHTFCVDCIAIVMLQAFLLLIVYGSVCLPRCKRDYNLNGHCTLGRWHYNHITNNIFSQISYVNEIHVSI